MSDRLAALAPYLGTSPGECAARARAAAAAIAEIEAAPDLPADVRAWALCVIRADRDLSLLAAGAAAHGRPH